MRRALVVVGGLLVLSAFAWWLMRSEPTCTVSYEAVSQGYVAELKFPGTTVYAAMWGDSLDLKAGKMCSIEGTIEIQTLDLEWAGD
jgi:hypothetical protein